VLQKLFVSSDATVRAAAAETCSHGIFGEATSAALGKLLADPSPQVRNAVFRAIASYANWRSPAAQQVLIQRATDKSLDLDARLDAADALGQAVKLQAAGVPQDPPMFRALVSLLDEREKNEPLRAAAFIACSDSPISSGLRRRAISSGWRMGEVAGQDHNRTGWRRDLLPRLRSGRQQPHGRGTGGSILRWG
jgi:HEAT repeat protein